jgi:transposase
MTVQELVFKLLGSIYWLKIERISVGEEQVWVSARSIQSESPCPVCGVMSRSIHSHYERTLQDLAWGSYSVRIGLKARRFRCGQAGCKREVFTERYVDWVVAYARRINRLSELLSQLGILVGSSTASEISKLVSVEASPSTTLRQVKNREVPKIAIQAASTLSAIGVDDFAFKRRKSYGTVIVNLETKKAIELLPDRTSESLAKWLKDHPNINVISRDRSTEYAKGIAEGAPQAKQVLDRWHLLSNMGEVLERVLQHHQAAIKQIAQTFGVRPRKRTTKEEKQREERRKERHERYQAIRELHQKGFKINQIMRKLGYSRTQVRQAISSDQLPERYGNHHKPSILAPFEPHLHKRWEEGIRNAHQLFREIKSQGFRGGTKQVHRWAQERREVPFKHKQLEPGVAKPNPDSSTVPRLSDMGLAPSQLSWLMRKDHESLKDNEQLILKTLLDSAPELKTAQTLAHEFSRLFHSKKADEVEPWISCAIESGIAEFKSFAVALQRELDALKAAVALPWSNGPVEGWVNKIKFIKRQMYGRASFDLLRKRVLLCA